MSASYEFSTAKEAGVTAGQLTELINAAMQRSESHLLASTRTNLAEVSGLLSAERVEFLIATAAVAMDGAAPDKVLAAVVRVNLPAAGSAEAMCGMVCTAQGHERKGLAASLIADAERRGLAAGAATLGLHFPTVREDMFKYYGKLGFEHWRDTDMPERFECLVAKKAWPLRLRWMRKHLTAAGPALPAPALPVPAE